MEDFFLTPLDDIWGDFSLEGAFSVPENVVKDEVCAVKKAKECKALSVPRAKKAPVKRRRGVGRNRKPKKPRTGYNYFHIEERSRILEEVKQLGVQDKEALNAEVNKRIARRWRALTCTDKMVHIKRANEDKVRFANEMEEYNQYYNMSREQAEIARHLPSTLEELRSKAEAIGIKKPGVGWPVCCPPNGTKIDIRNALISYALKNKSQELINELSSGSDWKLFANTVRPHTPALRNPGKIVQNRVKMGEQKAIKPATSPLLMTMKGFNSKTWLFEMAERHNLLSDNTRPLLTDAMDLIEKELTLTMTRMSNKVLSIVASKKANKKETIHTLIKECSSLQASYTINESLVNVVDRVSVKDVTQPQEILKLVTGSIQGFYLLNKPLCDLLISEAKRCARECNIKLGQISVANLGLAKVMEHLALRCILPALGHRDNNYEVDGAVIYDGDKPLNDDAMFTQDPSDTWKFEGSQRSLPDHKDDSKLTINLCLGDNFTGGSVMFENVFEVKHQICRGIVHPGHIRHRVTPCKGRRFNLILFLNSRD